jgi:carbon-monoxide dehydrogenase medium subunit/xanthine dehydrogenase FAD-binding subunit
MLTCDEYITPASLDEAFDAMAAHCGRYRIVAGATDTLPWAREGRAGDVHSGADRRYKNQRIAGYFRRRQTRAARRRHADSAFSDNKNLARSLPAMPRCAVWFADDQIWAQATIGGNI